VLEAGVPLFGICFGSQILGRAIGLSTYKLRYGHRGVNQPVMDLATGRVYITSHNHGFAAELPRGDDPPGSPRQPPRADPPADMAANQTAANQTAVAPTEAKDIEAHNGGTEDPHPAEGV
jgi:carbamoyl-phosphate synthase small subunit